MPLPRDLQRFAEKLARRVWTESKRETLRQLIGHAVGTQLLDKK